MSGDELRIAIRDESDLASALLQLRGRAEAHDFGVIAVNQLATALSELARNILKYADHGVVEIRTLQRVRAVAIEIVVCDRGPGIADVAAAMRDHVSTGGTLGLGLPGVRRLMDEFEIRSEPGRGTRVTIRRWR